MSTPKPGAPDDGSGLPAPRLSGPRTIGPVADLERHLPSDWWRTLFNSFYLKTDGDVVENDQNTRLEVDLVIDIAHLGQNDRVLDLCCGQGRHCLELARRGFRNVVGIDRSRYLVQLARRRARKEGLSVTFHEGDARKWTSRGRPFDCVAILGNSFGYFEQKEDDTTVLTTVSRNLSPGGTLVMDIVDGAWLRTNFEPRSWEWIDENHLVCRERSLSGDRDRLIAREVIVHAEKGVLVDQFYAERLYDADQISALLESVGFRMVRFHNSVQSASNRNQDLGMMAHRIILSAMAPTKKTTVTSGAVPFPKVTVLLGDASLPDKVKLDGEFGDLDFDTIERLKSALARLEGYEFRYMDDHQSLIRALLNDPPDFVLNLCDEGYWNDPFKELHVPALLEMLHVPYTGAPPTCLGLCYNKAQVRAIAESLDVPTPLESYIGPDDSVATLPATFPALVKPNFGDSSVGITEQAVVSSKEELLDYIDRMRETMGRIPVLVQEFLTGAEYSVGVIGNPGLSHRVLPILQVDYSGLDSGLPRILGYESKWVADSPYWAKIKFEEASVPEDLQRKIADDALRMFERLGCRDYARFDYRADAAGVVKLLEVNPNPGWCWDGKLALMAGFAGMTYADLLGEIIRAAQERVHAETAVNVSPASGLLVDETVLA